MKVNSAHIRRQQEQADLYACRLFYNIGIYKEIRFGIKRDYFIKNVDFLTRMSKGIAVIIKDIIELEQEAAN